MLRITSQRVARLLTLALITTLASPTFAADSLLPEASKHPVQAIAFQARHGAKAEQGANFVIRGRDGRHQLLVAGDFGEAADVRHRDVTRLVSYSVKPANVIAVDAAGLVSPLADGKAVVTATSSNGKTATVSITVEQFTDPAPINFPNKVVPIFTKLGCNGGGCHGKSGGQNGFRLSLLGFEPTEDYEFLVREGRGRRLFPAAPDNSLLLTKSINAAPHGGGKRMEKNSHDYRVLRRWIEQGMPYGNADDPTVSHLEVLPRPRTMVRSGEQQIVVLAHYTDGSIEDVTHTAQYEANDKDMAEVNEAGHVISTGLSGDIAVMVRYQGKVGVYRSTVPLGIKNLDLPSPNNYVDQHVLNKLKMLGMPPSPLSDDATFLRRVTLDVAGRLPTLEETNAFMASTEPLKRQKWVDTLLASSDYAEYFANKWAAVLRNKRRKDSYKHGTFSFHAWLKQSLHENKPYDKLVRDVIAASGDIANNPPVAWYREVKTRNEQMEDVAQLFLGVRMQCAQCHHHPFEKWSQDDYYSFAAFFSRVGRKNGDIDEQRIFHQRGAASANNPKTKQNLKPAGLGDDPLALTPDQDPRHALADWMASKGNPFFAKALVNRYWKHFFNRGLVDPEDDMRETNPATNPELLDALAANFIKSGFDLKQLVRDITTSKTYQLSAMPNKYNAKDKQNFSRYYPRRLNAEVLLDSIDKLTKTQTRFNGVPAGMRAVALPDSETGSYFLTVFGRPESSSACECERTGDANLAQSLHLLNSREIQAKLSSGRANELANDKARSDEAKVEELYMIAFARKPDSDERQTAIKYLGKYEAGKKKEGYEDLIWALINTKEFLFNH